MLYFKFHIGDWESKTKFLNATEKGIYIDLLLVYYSRERPLERLLYERMYARYSDVEREAADFVINEFFELKGDSYVHRRCDEEIEAWQEKSAKASKANSCRKNIKNKGLDKSKGTNGSSVVGANDDERSTSVEQTLNERSENVQLTNNHKPLTNNNNKHITNTEAIEDPNHVLTAPEMVVVAGSLGIPLSHTLQLDGIAAHRTITVDLFNRCVSAWKDGPSQNVGYLVGILSNAAKNPQTVESNAKQPLSAETITSSQAHAFAYKLVKDRAFCREFARSGESENQMIERIELRLFEPGWFAKYRPYLVNLKLIKED